MRHAAAARDGPRREIDALYRVGEVMCDGHGRESIKEHLDAAKLRVAPAPEGTGGKADVFAEGRVTMHEGRLLLPWLPKLREQLREVVARPTASGTRTITSPRRAGSGHGDLVSALVLAMWQANRGPPPGGWPRPEPFQGESMFRMTMNERGWG